MYGIRSFSNPFNTLFQGVRMASRFEKLLEPGWIGPVKTRNKMLKTFNRTSLMEEDQTCGPRIIAFYEGLSKGGIRYLTVDTCGHG